MPLRDDQVDVTVEFGRNEKLFRRFLQSEVVDGEITPASVASMSFKDSELGAPSVVRERFGTATDALHPDCGAKDAMHFLIFSLRVCEIPKEVLSQDGRRFDFFPRHIPTPTCGAHSVISCCLTEDPSMTYSLPSKSARLKFRTILAIRFCDEFCSNFAT